MKIKVLGVGSQDRKTSAKLVLKWVIYILMLILFYMIGCSLPFIKWQPLLLIPLAVAVATFEGECAGAIFGVVCGMMIDMASGGLFGFTSLWLMPCCLLVTLFTVNLLHQNFLNYMWMTAATFVIVELMDIFFKYIIWREENVDILFFNYILPSALSAIILSPLVYLAVKKLSQKLGFERSEKDMINSFEENGAKMETRE